MYQRLGASTASAAVPVLVLTLLATLAAAPAAFAQPPAGACAVPPGLGASLLYPYVEVDLDDVNGPSTILSVNNGSALPHLARVVVWSDWGNPALAFDVWLGGFDVQTINVRNLLDGVIPSTGAGEDLSAFDFCGLFPPNHVNPVLTAAERNQLRADLTGTQGPTFDTCIGESYGDGFARGYVTVDLVDECSGVEAGQIDFSPAASDLYFDDGDGESVAINENFLWGDYTYLDFAGEAAQGSQAVPLWADPSQFTGPDQYTFYGRFHNYDGRDHRVPLPYAWNQRFLNGGTFGGGADLIVWRDPEAGMTTSAPCGTRPAVFPLTDVSVAFDEDSDVVDLGNFNFPIAAQRVPIDQLSVPFDFGWIQVLPPATNSNQFWVETTLSASANGFSASWPGAPALFLCDLEPSMN